MNFRFFMILFTAGSLALARDGVEADPMGGSQSTATNQPTTTPAEAVPLADPMGGTSPAQNKQTNANEKGEAAPSAPAEDSMGSATPQTNTPNRTSAKQVAPKPPLTPEIANLNLPSEVEIPNEDPDKVLYLPAGTYRQILQIPIDSPTMESANQSRIQRRPEVKVPPALPVTPIPNTKPLWIRYESLEKVKIGKDERRGGIDLPVHGPADLKPRLWYAKSETADTWSSLFYFVFGGAGYSAANLAGWSAGNVREIPIELQYRLIRK